MAVLYKESGKKFWYVDFIDPDTGKKLKRCTFIPTNVPKNRAKKFSARLEVFIQKRKTELLALDCSSGTILEAMNLFFERNSGKSYKTKQGYSRFFEELFEFFDESKPCIVLNKRNVESWLIQLNHRSEYSQNTKYNFVKILRKFLRFLREYNYIENYIINSDITPKQEKIDVKCFEDVDANLIIESLDKYSLREDFKFVIKLLYFTGKRPSDIINITRAAFNNNEQSTLRYYSQKMKKYEEIPLRREVADIIADRIKNTDNDRLINFNDVSDIGKMFQRYLKKLEMNGKGYTLRTFRKYFATKGEEKGISPVVMSQLLGHSNINTTYKHYNSTIVNRMAAELQKFDS